MHKLLISFIISFFSLSSFAQSYLVMENGAILTTDTSGFIYDFGHDAVPQKITLRGGQYFVEEGNILTTVDENGMLFRKYDLIPSNLIGKGINYFISEEGFLFTFDRAGVLKVTESEIYKSADSFGGRFFTVTDNKKFEKKIFVVNADGKIVKPIVPDLDLQEIISLGGNYFMTNRGMLYSITQDGEVFAEKDLLVGNLQKKGGNFFVDSLGIIYTVTDAGEILIPSIPVNLKTDAIKKTGSNYFIDHSGAFFVVDKDGNILEKRLPQYDFKRTQVISL